MNNKTIINENFIITEQENTFVKKYTKFITYVDEDESVENEGNFVVKFSNGLVFLTNVGNSVVVKFAQMGGVSRGKLEGKDYQMIECKQSDGKDVVFLLFSDGRLRISLTSLIIKQLELPDTSVNPEENYVEFYK